MNCNETAKLLSAHQDGSLTSGEETEMRAHLAVCATCQKEERLLSELWTTLKVLEPIEPSPNFRARFWQKVREEEDIQESWLRRSIRSWHEIIRIARPAFALTSIVLAVVLGTFVALRIVPPSSPIAEREDSPIMEWAKSVPSHAGRGGFRL